MSAGPAEPESRVVDRRGRAVDGRRFPDELRRRHRGRRLVGMVPKSFLPTYREFYEGRHFRAASPTDPKSIEFQGSEVPFGSDLVFCLGQAKIGIEICEDLWDTDPTEQPRGLAGANVLLNLSASNELIGKAAWRRDLVRSQSGRCLAAYAYASSGPGESTSDLVFGGHCLIAETAASWENRGGSATGVNRAMSTRHRSAATSICNDSNTIDASSGLSTTAATGARRVPQNRRFTATDRTRPVRPALLRRVDAHPFVPDESEELDLRCAEIFAVQVAALVKRLSRLSADSTLAIGVSGGLDSTLALLVAVRACDASGRSRESIQGITMPGFGTTSHTRTSADQLIEMTGVTGGVYRHTPAVPRHVPFDPSPSAGDRHRRRHDRPAAPGRVGPSRRRRFGPDLRERSSTRPNDAADESWIRLGDGRHERTGARMVDLQRGSHVDVQRQTRRSRRRSSASWFVTRPIITSTARRRTCYAGSPTHRFRPN